SEAALKELYRHHKKTCLRVVVDEDAFDARQRTLSNPHPVSFFQVRVRQDRESRVEDLPYSVDFRVGDNRRPIPPFAENASKAVRLHDLDVAGLVDGMTNEE